MWPGPTRCGHADIQSVAGQFKDPGLRLAGVCTFQIHVVDGVRCLRRVERESPLMTIIESRSASLGISRPSASSDVTFHVPCSLSRSSGMHSLTS